jgi:hypothetical protein
MNTWLRIRIFGETLIVLRAPLIAFAIGILLPCSSQMEEAFQINARDLSNTSLINPIALDTLLNHFTFSAIGVIFVASIIYLLGRLISLHRLVNSESYAVIERDNLLVILPIFLFFAYIARYAYVLFISFPSDSDSTWHLRLFIGLILVVFGICTLVIFFRILEPLAKFIDRVIFPPLEGASLSPSVKPEPA